MSSGEWQPGRAPAAPLPGRVRGHGGHRCPGGGPEDPGAAATRARARRRRAARAARASRFAPRRRSSAPIPGMLALDPTAPRERTAHRRDFKTYRFLRAYPGAPPRIPHVLSPEEFKTGSCRTCHQRGGYSQRFGAYVPVTPHPERGICLQCHAGEDSLMGVDVPIDNPKARCPLCHGPSGGRPRADASLTWPTSLWPSPRSAGAGSRPATDPAHPAVPGELPGLPFGSLRGGRDPDGPSGLAQLPPVPRHARSRGGSVRALGRRFQGRRRAMRRRRGGRWWRPAWP